MTTERIWFTSDTHFSHKNIQRFCPTTRLGKDIEEHDEILIRNWNAVVKPNDRVYHLGDISWGNADHASKLWARLMGNVYVIWGNHDNVYKNNAKLRERFTWHGDYKEVDLPVPAHCGKGTHKVCLFHFPIYEWNRMHHGAFHLYGHVHASLGGIQGSWQVPGRALDVGVDTRPPGSYMTMWPWEEVYRLLIKREIRGHHDVKKGM